mmetsp:Transcript_67117/g.212408  ORF Transcript_67117/g.212408 Transcript_67117/m.212408 type:complete len:204 (+) Transcript_67117:674-1285(+)
MRRRSLRARKRPRSAHTITSASTTTPGRSRMISKGRNPRRFGGRRRRQLSLVRSPARRGPRRQLLGSSKRRGGRQQRRSGRGGAPLGARPMATATSRHAVASASWGGEERTAPRTSCPRATSRWGATSNWTWRVQSTTTGRAIVRSSARRCWGSSESSGSSPGSATTSVRPTAGPRSIETAQTLNPKPLVWLGLDRNNLDPKP